MLDKEHPTRSDIMKFMDHLYDPNKDLFLYFKKGFELDWADMCVECNVRNWLYQKVEYFGWR